MSKRNGATKAAAPAAPAAGLAASLSARSTDKAIDMSHAEPGVIEWDPGNGQSTFQSGQLPPEQLAADGEAGEVTEGDAVAPADAPDDAAATTKTEAQPAASTEQNQQDGEKPPGTVSPPSTQPVKPRTEARRDVFDRLAAEQRRVALERQARQNAEEAAAAKAELLRVKKLPLKEKLKFLEVDRESLEEALLVGGDDVAELPDKKQPQEDPRLAALQAEVEALKAERQAREQLTQAQTLERANAVIVEALKDNAAVPMVKAVRDIVVEGRAVSGIGLTLEVANQKWLQSGQAGHPRDYIAGAAEVVEQYLREKRPDLAEVIVPRGQQQTGGNGAPAPRQTGAQSIGKRTAPRPDAQPKELPMDKYQRDQAIKREMGW